MGGEIHFDTAESPGPRPVGREMLEVDREWLMIDGDFLIEQREDPTLSHVWEQFTSTEEEGDGNSWTP